jgi:ABC-type transporter MlaC component
METKQTAVEWLEQQIIRFHNWKLNPIYDENCFDEIELDKAIKQAKKMEKQQIENAFENGMDAVNIHNLEQYYNETFNK